jgi:hypothetical protein
MKKDKAAEERMKQLEEAGVSSGSESQVAKIREMSDEEFASYKEERVELRNAVIAELEANKEAPAEEAAEEEVEEEAAAEEEAAEEEVETPPAEVDPNKAISAALNMESIPSTDLVSKYAEMGKAMAKLMTGKKDE